MADNATTVWAKCWYQNTFSLRQEAASSLLRRWGDRQRVGVPPGGRPIGSALSAATVSVVAYPAAGRPLIEGTTAVARRGVPFGREHRQGAERAAADIEGHFEATKFGQPGTEPGLFTEFRIILPRSTG